MERLPFFNYNDVSGHLLINSYEPDLLIVSILIALISSCIAIVISTRAHSETSGQWKKNLLLGSSIVQGLGLWSMHFIGMLAIQTEVDIDYSVSITLLSLLPALLTGYIIVNTPTNITRPSARSLLTRGLMISGAIALMHFFGMMSMQTEAHMQYNYLILSLAFVFSLALTLLAIKLYSVTSHLKQQNLIWPMLAAGISIGLAIITAHYLSVAGTSIYVTDLSILDHDHGDHNNHIRIIWLVAMAMVVSIGILLLAMHFSRRMEIISKVEEHNRYASGVIDNTAEGIIVINNKGAIETFNPAAEHIFGYKAKDVIGKDVSLLLPEHERQEHKQYTKNSTLHSTRIINRGRDLQGRRKDGSLFPLELNVAPLNIKGRKGFIGLARDITERKQSELELKKSNERLNFLLTSSPIVIYTRKAEGDFGTTYISPNISDVFGYKPSDFTDNPEFWVNNIHPEDKDAVFDNLGILFEHGTHAHEYRFKMSDGTYCWVHDELRLVRNAQCDVVEIVGSWSNINDKKQVEIALQRNEERFRRSQIFANIGTWDWNIQSGELYWSERIGPLFGYPEGKLETTYENFINAVHPDDRQDVMDAVNNCVENNTDYNIEHRIVWPDGQVRWALERGDVTRAEDGTPLHMLGVVIDITERKKLEETLSEQQMLLNLLRQGMIDYVSDSQFSNVADKLLVGLLELTGSEYGFTGEIRYNDDGSPYLKTHAISNIAWSDETRQYYDDNAPDGMEFKNIDTLFGAVLKTGTVVIANDAPHDPRRGGLPDGHPPLNAFLGVPVYYGDKMVGMYGLTNRPGGYDEALLEFLRPFDLTYGVIIHALKMTQTEKQNLLDLEQAKDEAEKASKAKSEFLSRMSHELRTPMNAILGFTQILQLDGDEILPSSYQDSLNEIMGAGQHLLELINDVLDLARIEAGNIEMSIEPLAVGEIFNTCQSLIAPLAAENSLTIEFDHPDDQLILTDKTKLKQILINLLSNAVKYNKKHGHIRVSSEFIDDHMRINVSDTGSGIPADRQDELFTAFNRIDADSSGIEGTGIGLVITRNLVEKMGGHINFTSAETGTTFWVELPLASPLIAPAQTQSISSNEQLQADASTFNILYIEDNMANVKLIQQALKRHDGIMLTTVETAELGLEEINKQPFDLILLDINLPGMSGYELLSLLRNNPDTRSLTVYGMSANAMPADIARAKEAGFDQYITKPVNLTQLTTTINKLL